MTEPSSGVPGSIFTPAPAALGTPPVGAPVLDPTAQRFIDTLAAENAPPIYTLSPADARRVLDSLQSSTPVLLLPSSVQDTIIPTNTAGPVSIRIVRPQGIAGPLPAAIYLHGGGWILGNKQTHDRLVRELAFGANVALIFVNYTPSPEARFPVAVEQAYAVTRYIAENGGRFNIDGSRLAVLGDSVGGNLATVVALLAKERGGPSIARQLLFYPVTNADFDSESYRTFADGPWLTKRAMEWFFDAYAPDPLDRRRPAVSPLLASDDQLRGLPPALIITDENDVLRDEGEAYARRLMQVGVAVKAVRCLGTIHDFMMLNALASTPATRAAITLAIAELRSALWT